MISLPLQTAWKFKNNLETADASTGFRQAQPASSAQRLYEPPLDMFGADAVERWFTEKVVEEVVNFVQDLVVN
jgi:hypothetical protein